MLKGIFMSRCGITCVLSLLMIVFSFDSQAGFKEGMDALKKQDFSTAYKEWKIAAENEDVDAQYAFAMLNYNGQGVAQNFQQAFYWLSKVADKGKAPAQFYLGVMYYNGQGVEKSYKQALSWYTKAAEQGIPLAQYNLGVMYFSAQGTDRDIKKSLSWYTKAADNGYAPAQYQLGAKYLNGQGVEKDESQAVAWFTKAAELGYADAQHDLAVMYFDGQGVKTDRKQAAYWDTLASAQGNDDAQYNLALQYYYGRGVKSDKVIAVALLTLSKSDQSSQMLTNMFVHNEISNQEKITAYKLKDQMQKNGNFINALNNYISSHSVEDISNVNSPTAVDTGKVNYQSAAKDSNTNSPSVDTDFVKNGMPCMDGICIGDPVSKFAHIKWDKVKKHDFKVEIFGYKSAKDELNDLKSHFAPSKREFIEKISSYLITNKFDSAGLVDLSKLSGICERFHGSSKSLDLVDASNTSELSIRKFNAKLSSVEYLITNVYEMTGSYLSAGGNSTRVTVSLSISKNPEYQVMRVSKISREIPRNISQEQLREISQQINQRYTGVNKATVGDNSRPYWDVTNGAIMLEAPIWNYDGEIANHLRNYPGCTSKIRID